MGNETNLDSIPGCVNELTDCNREVAKFAHEWAQQSGELKRLEKRYQRLFQAAMRGTQGRNAEERNATAHAAVDAIDEGLAERIENLIGSVETSKRLFETIERRSSNAQSILALHRKSADLDPYIPRGEFTPPGGLSHPIN